MTDGNSHFRIDDDDANAVTAPVSSHATPVACSSPSVLFIEIVTCLHI